MSEVSLSEVLSPEVSMSGSFHSMSISYRVSHLSVVSPFELYRSSHKAVLYSGQTRRDMSAVIKPLIKI